MEAVDSRRRRDRERIVGVPGVDETADTVLQYEVSRLFNLVEVVCGDFPAYPSITSGIFNNDLTILPKSLCIMYN
jgi:hypothetical protein